MAEEINFQLKSPEEINFGRKLTLLKKKSREEINFNFLLKAGVINCNSAVAKFNTRFCKVDRTINLNIVRVEIPLI